MMKKRKGVNVEVDIHVSLVEIPGVRPEWQTAHLVRALVINGESPALSALAEWKRKYPADYARIMRRLEEVAFNKRVAVANHAKADREKSGIYELRAHRSHARLFFFYSPEQDEIVVCTHGFTKSKPSPTEQGIQFERARRLMNCYLRYFAH